MACITFAGMNDYAHGALETLVWVLNLLEGTNDTARIRRQVEGARDDLLAGVSVNFRQRLKTRYTFASGYDRTVQVFKRMSLGDRWQTLMLAESWNSQL